MTIVRDGKKSAKPNDFCSFWVDEEKHSYWGADEGDMERRRRKMPYDDKEKLIKTAKSSPYGYRGEMLSAFCGVKVIETIECRKCIHQGEGGENEHE
jgi:hypothetical protein